MRIESQNIDIPACRFYASQGCQLGTVHRFEYADYPDEFRLIGYKSLWSFDSCHFEKKVNGIRKEERDAAREAYNVAKQTYQNILEESDVD